MDKDLLWSGAVHEGTKNVSCLAEQLVKKWFWRSGFCGIAIANDTGKELISSGYYCFSGKIDTCPLVINPNHTGLIMTRKFFLSPHGSDGVVTYKISGYEDRHLQIMWSAPIYRTFNENCLNVAIGPETASKNLFELMLCGRDRGQVVLARHTSHFYTLDDDFKAVAMMGQFGPTPLAVLFKKLHNVSRGAEDLKIASDM